MFITVIEAMAGYMCAFWVLGGAAELLRMFVRRR